ncbi:centrosomal protein of 83 kDa-like isoform X2 [Watersipora subatra]|uniref:centrosomal protein of 83 kDa-like isoform X2 n=1 Tax=Watersipora subatra TaxID=2589382 RepID=UPI00355B4C35
MASPIQHFSRGDTHASPVLGQRSPNMNGSIHPLPNGTVRKLSGSGVDPSTNQYLEKHDEAHFLANLLAEERQRCAQHKENYNTLKQEHRKLQTEMLDVQEEVRKLAQEKNSLTEKHAVEIGDYESQLTALRQKNLDLQGMVPARERIDALKSQMISDVEGPFRNRLNDLELENESLRSDATKLKHDFAFLRTEYEHTLQRHKSTLDDLRLQHEAEVKNLNRDKDELVSRLHQDNSGDIDKLHNLQKDNSTLNHRVKSLLTELEELRGQREKCGLESDHVNRLQTKQMTEFQANVRALEIEKNTLRQQCDSQSRELSVLVDTQTELTRRLHDEEQRAASVRNELESLKHESTLQLTESKLAAVKAQGLIERERDSLHSQVDDLKCRIEAQQLVMQQMEVSLRDKERDCAEKVNCIREEEFQKHSQLNHDKQGLESRLQQLERQKVELEDRLHRDQLRYEQQVREIANTRSELEKDLNAHRSKIHNQTQLQTDLEYERSRANDQRNQLMKIEAENSALRTTESELTELIGHLRLKLAANNEEMRRSKHIETTQHATADKVLAQHKAVWADEKKELKKRVDELDAKVIVSRNALSKDTAEFNKKKQIYSKLVEKLRRKLEISEAEKKELHIQVESVKGYIPPEIYNRLRKELKDLKGRHKEYKHIMLSSDITHVPIGDRSFASASVHNANFDISPDHTQETVEDL